MRFRNCVTLGLRFACLHVANSIRIPTETLSTQSFWGKHSTAPPRVFRCYLVVLLPGARSALVDDFAREQCVLAGIDLCVLGLLGEPLEGAGIWWNKRPNNILETESQ